MSKFQQPQKDAGAFQHPKTGVGTISIGSVDVKTLTVDAQYNPKELQIDKQIPWSKKNQANKSGDTGIQLEYTGADGRSLTLELLFDGYETNTSVVGQVEKLNEMASVWKPKSKKEEERRPHLCVVKWSATLPKFTCVIESLSAKYTMFSPEGVPLRATCTLKLKEADSVTAKAGGGGGQASGGGK